jgi:hypothetical protein
LIRSSVLIIIMPSDIRSFFGGKPAAAAAAPAKDEKKKAPAKKGRARKVVDDSDDEEAEVCVTRKSLHPSRVNHMLMPVAELQPKRQQQEQQLRRNRLPDHAPSQTN